MLAFKVEAFNLNQWHTRENQSTSPIILGSDNAACFYTVLRRLVAWIRSSLLLKIQWKEHHYLYKHGC
jgi:hypothetical protein